jgi:hypothetical protein
VLTPARSPSSARARSRRPRRSFAAPWPPCAGAALRVAVYGPRVPPHPPTPSARSPTLAVASIRLSLPHSSAVERPSDHRTTAGSRAPPPPIAVALTHRHGLHLPPSFAFSLRIPCSPRPIGILPLAMIMAHWSSGRAHRSELLRGLHPSILLLIHFSRLRAPHSRGEARRPHHASHLSRCWPADGGPSHHVAMHAGKIDAELVWPHAKRPRLRLVAGNRVVVTSVTRELTAGENAAVSSRCV